MLLGTGVRVLITYIQVSHVYSGSIYLQFPQVQALTLPIYDSYKLAHQKVRTMLLRHSTKYLMRMEIGLRALKITLSLAQASLVITQNVRMVLAA